MLFFLIWLLIMAILLRVDFVFYLVYIGAGVYIWTRWIASRRLHHVTVLRSFADHAFLGERVAVTLRLENPSWIAMPWIQLNESIPVALRSGDSGRYVLALPGRDKAECTYHVSANRRGYYQLGPLNLSAGDLFGFHEQKGIVPPNYLTVYPRIIPLAQLGLPSRLPFGTVASQQRLFEDPARPVGIRHYQSGDSLRQINWKVSAHTDSLVVKTLQPAISLETIMMLNLNIDDFKRRQRHETKEWGIIVAASIAASLVNQRQAVGLASNGTDLLSQDNLTFDQETGRLQQGTGIGDRGSDTSHRAPDTSHSAPDTLIPPRPGRANLMKVLEKLARIEFSEADPFDHWLARATTGLSWGTTLVIITPAGTTDITNALHRLVRAGYNPVLIATQPSLNFGTVRERARRLGFTAYQVTLQSELVQLQTENSR